MTSQPPQQPEPTGPPGPPPQPTPPPPNPEVALWPANLPKEPTGWRSVRQVFGTLAIFLIPLGGLTLLGNQTGPFTKDYESNSQISVEGTSHDLLFDLPLACKLDLGDPSMSTFTCTKEDREVEVTVRPAETIDDLDMAAKRAARQATINRSALDFPSESKEIQGGMAAHVTSGTGLLSFHTDSIAVSPDADESGFVINISEPDLEEGEASITPELTNHLLANITFKKTEEEAK